MHCKCGCELTWGEYFKTIQHRQLSGAEPVLNQFRSFVQEFSIARTPPEKTILIDRLIHEFHWHSKSKTPTRPVAINLIEGRLSEMVAFLENLSCGAKSTPRWKRETPPILGYPRQSQTHLLQLSVVTIGKSTR